MPVVYLVMAILEIMTEKESLEDYVKYMVTLDCHPSIKLATS